MDAPDPQTCCLPGDITIAAVHTGYMLGRALPEHGPGPWWEYVGVTADLETAVRHARAMATAASVHVWFHHGGFRYSPVALDDSEFRIPARLPDIHG